MLRIPNRQNLHPELYCTEFSENSYLLAFIITTLTICLHLSIIYFQTVLNVLF